MRGQMLWFNEAKDYGFIMTDDGERLAVAGEGFAKGEKPEGRCAHKVVTFEVEESNGDRQAQNVVFEPEVVARRARMRSGGRGIRH
jgi:cold shock CspA family protein